MTCQDGYEFIGGEPEGARGCTSSSPRLADPPVCHKKEVIKCEAPDQVLDSITRNLRLESIYKDTFHKENVKVSFCDSCVAGDDSCRCTATCEPGYIEMPGSSAKQGKKRCVAQDVPSSDKECSILSASQCVKSVYKGKRCCYQSGKDLQAYRRGHSGVHNVDVQNVPSFMLDVSRSFRPASQLVPTGFTNFPKGCPMMRRNAAHAPRLNMMDRRPANVR
eukprot:symbB.v1.2.004392.t1/scaffold223.1/size261697/9